MIPSLEQWTPRPPIDQLMAEPLVGNFVRVDRWQPQDTESLWQALGGGSESINERLKWWGIAPFETPQELGDLLESIDSVDSCCVNILRVLVKNDDPVIGGMACYIATEPDHGTTEVGYVAHGESLARTPAATEAHYLMAQRAFEAGYRRYEWKCDSNNMPSNNAAQRFGFTFEGCFRQHRVTAQQTNRDTNWYSMLDHEWRTRKAAFEAWLDPSNFDASGRQIKRLQDF